MRQTYPILEFDPERDAIIDPVKLIQPHPEMPEHGVITFFQDVLEDLVAQGFAVEIASLKSEMGAHPVYVHHEQGRRVALFHPGVGAPLAAGLLEEVIALGCRKLIACGGAGVLDREIAAGHLVVPTSAVRDEGTSYHYLPPGREATPSAAGVAAIEATLGRRHVPYVLAKTWTTDGIYRETRGKMALRCRGLRHRGDGGRGVVRAVAVPRRALAQVLYGGDNLDADEWDSRDCAAAAMCARCWCSWLPRRAWRRDRHAMGYEATPAGRRKASPTGVRRYQLVNDPSSRRRWGGSVISKGCFCAASRCRTRRPSPAA